MINSGRFKKGQSPWNKGKKMPNSMREKMRIIASKRIGPLSPRWQEKPTYNAIHLWIRLKYGQANQCEKCGVGWHGRGTVHWANKSGKYLRDRKDWLRLCPKCHAKYDKRWLQRKRNKKGQFKQRERAETIIGYPNVKSRVKG